MVYVGLDVHHQLYIAALLWEGQSSARTITVRGGLDRLVERLKREAGGSPIAICFEASCDYGVVYERLCRIAHRVVVAHPKALRLIYGSKRKHDKLDAKKLAKLLMLDLVPSVHVPSVEVRSWRRLIQHRRSLVQQRTAVKAKLRALLRGVGLRVPRGLWSKGGRRWMMEQSWPTAHDGWQAEHLLDQLGYLDGSIKKVTRQLDHIGRAHPGVALLRTIPGIGPRTAETLVAWIDQVQRFGRTKQVAAYFGLVPCQDQSASRNRLGHITREGPSVARQMLVEAAWVARRKSPGLGAWFDRIVGDDPARRKIAAVALARHLARISAAMLRSGETFRPAA